MSRTGLRTLFVAAVVGWALWALAAILILSPALAGESAHPVSLADARSAPDYIAAIPAHAAVTFDVACVASDVSAYRADGRAIGAQHRTRAGLDYWRIPRIGGRVTFDGRTFVNRSSVRATVAVWCG